MRNLRSLLLNIVTLMLFVITFVSLLRFFEIDNCLDAGGMFDYTKGLCIDPRKEFSSLLWGNHLLFWIFISIISSIPTILIRYIGIKI